MEQWYKHNNEKSLELATKTQKRWVDFMDQIILPITFSMASNNGMFAVGNFSLLFHICPYYFAVLWNFLSSIYAIAEYVT